MSFNKGGSGVPRGFGFSGFVMPKKDSPHAGAAIPPPSAGFKSTGTGLSKQGYSTMSAISQNALSAQTSWGAPKKRSKTEDEYFEDEDETPSGNNLEYIPAPGSPSYNQETDKKESDSDSDPLDAFMEGIDQQFKKDLKKAERSAELAEKGDNKGIRDDIDAEDDEESYYRYMEENPMAGVQQEDSDVELEYDEDGNPIAPVKSKEIDPLPPIDHSTIEYAEFEKNFYCPHPEIAALMKEQVEELRQTLGIKVTGPQPPNPVVSFAHLGFDDALMKSIRKSEYTQPTAIQAQGVPAALSGRDIIGIAKTGSGKTAAFVWPMLVHIMDQKELGPGDGPIGLILAPTRELSQQIYNEARKFGKVYNIQVVCCYGGGSKWEQSKALEDGAEIVVATPGRMIDLVKMKATSLARVTFLVLDEADRMFDMGFEPQVRSICNHVRPDRQTLMFSATFKKKVERLARDVLRDPVRIVQGDIGGANEDIEQSVVVLDNQADKMTWLVQNLVKILSMGSLLIFTAQKIHAEELSNSLIVKEYECVLLHGDLDQSERNRMITAFKKKEVPILVATDVAARGLDISHIKTVVNYHVARDMDTHTHRIGRTGRAGEKGFAYTLVTKEDKELAGHLVRSLESVNQLVPQSLMNLALQSSWFRKSRFKGGKGKQLNIGGSGLGFRERPGLGTEPAVGPASVMLGASATAAAADVLKRCGPGSDRLSAMKAAFKSQYASQFKASSDHTWEHTRDQPAESVMGPPQSVESIPSTDTPAAATSDSKKKNKRSRWDDS